MPNWCSNFIYLKQENPAMLKAFKAISEDHTIGWQIPGIGMKSYFFEVNVDDDQIGFETRWATNIEDIKKIALFFKTDFELEYEESGMELYGKMIYQDGVFTDYKLDQTDLDRIIFPLDENGEKDWGMGPMTLDGKEYNSFYDLIEILIDQKIKTATNANTHPIKEDNGEAVSSNS